MSSGMSDFNIVIDIGNELETVKIRLGGLEASQPALGRLETYCQHPTVRVVLAH